MLDTISFIVYNVMLLISVFLLGFRRKALINKESYQSRGFIINEYIFLFLVAIIVALRYEVGKDWRGYVDIYNFYLKNNFNVNYGSLEIGYKFLNWWFGRLGLNHQFMFGVIAFLSWLLILRGSEHYLRYLFVMFLFLDGHFFWSMSGLRQFFSISIWLFSIQYIKNRQLLLFSLCVLSASLFHLSALFLFPLYFIQHNLIKNIRKWQILYVLTLIIGISGLATDTIRRSLFSILGNLPIYSKNINFFLGQELEFNSTEIGLGFVWLSLASFYILINARRILEKHSEFSIIFTLFFIGICLFNLTYTMNLVNRFNGYLIILRPLCLAIIISDQISTRYNRNQALIFIILYWIFYLSLIYNNASECSPYRIAI